MSSIVSFYSTLAGIILLAVYSSHIHFIHGQGLPKYMKACHRSDPKLNECVLKQAKQSSAIFARGDPVRGLPQLDPLEVKDIKTATFETQRFTGMKIHFSDSVVTGLGGMTVKDVKIDQEKRKIDATLAGNMMISSNYQMTGYFLFLPLRGSGASNVTLSDVDVSYGAEYEIVKGKDGNNYMNFFKDELDVDIGFANFQMDNLFYGINLFSGTANNLLNDYWRDVVAHLSPPLVIVLKEAFSNAVSIFVSQVPYDELLLP